LKNNLESLHRLLKEAAQAALLPAFLHSQSSEKADGSLLTAADIAMQQRVQSALQTLYAEIPLLGEESPPAEQQALLDSAERLWILDPLDGTRNFAAGFPFFAVSLALLEAGEVRLGMIYDPVRDECFYAAKNQGAWCNGQALGKATVHIPLAKSLALIDFKRLPPALAQRLSSTPPYASQRSLGSVALDWCWLAAGRVHLYLHGAQKLWDYAAASLILSEAGGSALTLAGDAVLQPSLAPRSVAAALDAELFQQWRDWLDIPR